MGIKQQLCMILYDICGLKIEETSLSDEMDLIEDLGLDSVGIVNLLLAVEEKYQIHLDQMNLIEENYTQIGCLCKIIDCTGKEQLYQKNRGGM
ncbi:MAG: acyl carrier protein [Lachnospiraceae bacterium]|nr:acyl carrier protein [Lachnospiraceae bacterium]